MKNTDHIDDDQLIAVLADHGSALAEAAGHLALCPMCQERRDQLEQRLLLVGQMAERFSPSPSRLPLSVAREAYRSETATKNWRRSITMGLSAASLIVLVGLSSALFFAKQPETVQFFSQEAIQDDLFMKEISRLEEDAIPPAFIDIINGQISTPDAPPDGRADPEAEYENMS
jgi:hypothetical protein